MACRVVRARMWISGVETRKEGLAGEIESRIDMTEE
jgi:hypothetical protein